jgi:hypothetical protein
MSLPVTDRIRGLDYVVPQYDAEWFREMARRIQRAESLSVATVCFMQMADTPAAIQALNHHKPQVPHELMGLNRAVHYLVRSELLAQSKTKEALHDVALAWRIAEGTIADDVRDFGGHARYLLDEHIEAGTRPPNHATRAEFLQSFDNKMQRRAVHMAKQRAARKQAVRVHRKN